MRLALTHQDTAPRWRYRRVTPDDAPLLGPLMYDAYHGTIDDEGEGPDDPEMERTLAGQYGPLLEGCSLLVEEDGRAVCATIVTWWREAPLLAFVMTHPSAQGQGMATFLIQQSINALLALGHTELFLAVTDGNVPAQRVYERLGFQIVP